MADQQYGAQLFANYVTRSPFLLCEDSIREYHEDQGGRRSYGPYFTTREPYDYRGHGHGHSHGYRTSTSSYPYGWSLDGERRHRHGTTRPPRDWEHESYRTTNSPYDDFRTTRPTTTTTEVPERAEEDLTDSWISTWDLIVGTIVLTSEKNAVEGPAVVLLKTPFHPYRFEEGPEGCQTVREYELRWDLDDLLHKLTADLNPGNVVNPLGIQFNLKLISLKDNSEAVKQYNAAFSKGQAPTTPGP